MNRQSHGLILLTHCDVSNAKTCSYEEGAYWDKIQLDGMNPVSRGDVHIQKELQYECEGDGNLGDRFSNVYRSFFTLIGYGPPNNL